MFETREGGCRRAVAWFACVLVLGACQAQGSPGALDRWSSGAALRQAAWKITSHPSGNLAKIGKRRAREIRRQRPPLRALIIRVYDGLFTDPARRDEILKKDFHPRAAPAFAANAGVPNDANVVETTLRKADIGIDAAGAARAAAAVTVRARGLVGTRPFVVLHRATLWLERRGGSWKVIAFDVRQKPIE